MVSVSSSTGAYCVSAGWRNHDPVSVIHQPWLQQPGDNDGWLQCSWDMKNPTSFLVQSGCKQVRCPISTHLMASTIAVLDWINVVSRSSDQMNFALELKGYLDDAINLMLLSLVGVGKLRIAIRNFSSGWISYSDILNPANSFFCSENWNFFRFKIMPCCPNNSRKTIIFHQCCSKTSS